VTVRSSTVASFCVDGGSLCVGGVPIEQLAQRVGSTPFFAYDRNLLTARVELLRSILPDGLGLSYAVKANPMVAVVQHLAGLVDSFDVASAHEMHIALDTPKPASFISFAGPGKTTSELSQAIAAGVTVEIESEGEAQRLVEIGERTGRRPRAAIRVNPDFQIRGSGMRLGGGSQQFGVDEEAVPALLGKIAAGDVDFVGFHVFAGSQILDTAILCEAQRRTVELLLKLSDASSLPVRYLNLGGGFGIPYFEKDEPLDIARVGENLEALIQGSIVGECGVYATRVLDRKVSRGHTYLVVDGGLHHQLAASGNFGQVIRRNYPLLIGNRMGSPAEEVVTVVGCLCTPLDILGDGVELPRAEVGDIIVVFQAGAYGLTASPTAFLGHPAPVETLV
jgi:diaminopimelate decarboxylase